MQSRAVDYSLPGGDSYPRQKHQSSLGAHDGKSALNIQDQLLIQSATIIAIEDAKLEDLNVI